MAKRGRKKLPTDERRKAQVRTFIEKHGRQKYSEAGKLGGGAASPGSFTSERGKAAAKARWDKWRAQH